MIAKEIQESIDKDVSRIKNNGNKIQRERALINYYNNPNYCQFCNNILMIGINEKPSDVRKRKYCCKECAAKAQGSYLAQISDEKFLLLYHQCSSINELMNVLGYSSSGIIQINIKKRIKALGLPLYQEIIEQKNHQITKGELFNSAKNWQCARPTIQKAARKNYKFSDKPKKCCICGYDKHYEVAHIKAVSSFDDNALIDTINNIDNLIALCPNHHWEYDNGLLNIYDEI